MATRLSADTGKARQWVGRESRRSAILDATTLPRALIKRYCLKYKSSSDREESVRAKPTLHNWPHLFTFLAHERVEPANNVSEQDLRSAVRWRKLCFGNRSENGKRFTERILTVTKTCRLRGKNPFRFLSDLMEAAFHWMPKLSLLF